MYPPCAETPACSRREIFYSRSFPLQNRRCCLPFFAQTCRPPYKPSTSTSTLSFTLHRASNANIIHTTIMASQRSEGLPQAADGSSLVPTKPVSAQQESVFFRLSAELRNSIYNQVVESPDEVWVCASRHYRLDDGTRAPLAKPPAITQVCRLIRTDTLPIFFGNAMVSVTLLREKNVAQAKSWADAVGEDSIKCVRRFRLSGYANRPELYNYPGFRIWVDKDNGGQISVRPDQDLLYKSTYTVPDAIAGQLCSGFQTRWSSLSSGNPTLACIEDMKTMVEAFARELQFRHSAADDGEGGSPEDGGSAAAGSP